MRAIAAILMVCVITASCDNARIYPIGDPRACQSACNGSVTRLEVLPGAGWDNLRNVEAGMVLAFNYSLCRTTEDGKYLIPDNVNVYAIKTSEVDSYAEIIETYNDYVSSTSRSINADAGFEGVFDISGSFSDEYLYTKRKQLEDDTFTTRVQARYVKYRAVLQPDIPLNPGFKYRLLSIAGSLELGLYRQARFDSQQLVREFGTHVSTSIDAGAAIIQEEQIRSEFRNSSQYTKTGVKMAASASFGVNVGLFFGGFSRYAQDQKMFTERYLNNRSDSVVKTMGGNIVNNTNTTTDDWIQAVKDNLVVIDRDGEPIFNFITAQTIPEIPASTLLQLTHMVQEAVQIYYKMNTHPGCTQRNAINFSPRANIDDGSCKPPSSDTNFGGIFQTCNNTQTDAGDLCTVLTQRNPATGDFSCQDGYEAVSLYSGTKTHQQIDHVCTSCWLIFGHCCHDESKTSQAQYETFWCARLENEAADPGYMFGGLYTSHQANPVTSRMSCPHPYLPLKMGEDIKVCISDQYLDAVQHAVPFAGFFSCTAGNPLSLGTNTNRTTSLTAHMYSAGPSLWPRRCPLGYSQFTTELMPEDGCEINHCIQPGALAKVKLPTIQRPPFVHAPVNAPPSQNVFVFDPAQNMWLKNGDAPKNATPSGRRHMGTSGGAHHGFGQTVYVMIDQENNYRPQITDNGGNDNDTDDTMTVFVISIIVAFIVFVFVVVVAALTKSKKKKPAKECYDNKASSVFVMDVPNDHKGK